MAASGTLPLDASSAIVTSRAQLNSGPVLFIAPDSLFPGANWNWTHRTFGTEEVRGAA